MADVANVTFDFAMSVTRIHEDPRVTRPYSDKQWAAIDALGERIDMDLAAGDVRLTQGGEPTFIAIDKPDDPEWNFTAMSPAKRRLAESLLLRLKTQFASGGMLHFGQGKWYPGEPLPRWALGVFWRVDGEPLWHDDSLVPDSSVPGRATIDSARTFIDALTTRLGLPAGYVLTAFEDVSKVLLDESALPGNVDPLAHDLSQPGERARIARLLRSGVDKPAGFVLPLKAVDEKDFAGIAWETSPWPLRRDRLYAVGGDSPLGFRLPLASLPDVLPDDVELDPEPDPYAARAGPPRSRRAAVAPGPRAGRQAARSDQDGARRRSARRSSARVRAARAHDRALRGADRRHRGYGANAGDALAGRRLSAAARSTHPSAARDPRSRRHRGERPSVVVLARADPHDADALRRGANDASCDREVHARRTPRRHGRRQSCDARWRNTCGQARCSAGPTCCRA
jgi:uncharacterized protein (DUF2126 family)